jgi:hypothetical protein
MIFMQETARGGSEAREGGTEGARAASWRLLRKSCRSDAGAAYPGRVRTRRRSTTPSRHPFPQQVGKLPHINRRALGSSPTILAPGPSLPQPDGTVCKLNDDMDWRNSSGR